LNRVWLHDVLKQYYTTLHTTMDTEPESLQSPLFLVGKCLGAPVPLALPRPPRGPLIP